MEDGKIYRVVIPEYNVNCKFCGDGLLISTGECNTKKDAEKLVKLNKTDEDSIGWRKINNFWYCGYCAEKLFKG